MTIRTTLLIAALCTVLTGCEQPPQPTASPTRVAQPQAGASTGLVAPAAFAACNACHAAGAGQHGLGPSLAGVFGRPAARAEGFNYSPALPGSGLVWDEPTLHRFLADPQATVPGTTMAYRGLRSAERRQEIIHWLKTI